MIEPVHASTESSAMPNYTVSSGQTSSGVNIGYDETMTVEAGGNALSTTVFLSGVQIIDAGGIARSTLVSAGGVQDVYGSAISTTFLSSGSTAGTAEAQGTVYSGGVSIDENIEGCYQFVYGTIENVSAVSSAQIYVESGGRAVNIELMGSNTFLLDAGAARYATVGAGSLAAVDNGSILISATIESGARLVASPLAHIAGTVVESGGELVLSNNATRPSGVTLNAGARVIRDYTVGSGQSISDVNIVSGGDIGDYGVMSNVTVLSGGVAYIQSHGRAVDTLVAAGGSDEIVEGDDVSATIRGSQIVGTNKQFEGEAQNTRILSGGFESVAIGVAKYTTIFSGGLAETYNDNTGRISGCSIMSGGTLELGTYISDVTSVSVKAGANIFFRADRFVSGTIESGNLYLYQTIGGQALDYQLVGDTSNLSCIVGARGANGTDVLFASASAITEAMAGFGAAAKHANTMSAHELQSARIDLALAGEGTGHRIL